MVTQGKKQRGGDLIKSQYVDHASMQLVNNKAFIYPMCDLGYAYALVLLHRG